MEVDLKGVEEAGLAVCTPLVYGFSHYFGDLMEPTEDRYLRPGEAARYLGITARWLGELRRRGDGPPERRIAGGQPRYLFSSLRAWAEGRHGPPPPTPPRPEIAAEVVG